MIDWIIAGVLAALILWGVFYLIFQRPNRLQTSRLTFHLDGLGGDEEGIRLAFLSDLHIRRPGKILRRAAAETAGFHPDMILWGGDFYAWLTHEPALMEYLSGFQAPAGSYAVQGNWEYKLQKTGPRLRQTLKECGIELLINEHRVVSVRRATFNLLGLDDAYTGHADFYSTFLGAPQDLPLVLLSHSPQVYRLARRWGVQLMLSGHTHGGQLVFPLIGPLWLPPGSEQTRQGLFSLGQTRLYVTRGLGTSIIPARLHCPPELVFITLKDSGWADNGIRNTTEKKSEEIESGAGSKFPEQHGNVAGTPGENQDTERTAHPLGTEE